MSLELSLGLVGTIQDDTVDPQEKAEASIALDLAERLVDIYSNQRGDPESDVHVVGRNASNTEPARFVVVLLKGKGAPILTPVKE